VLRILSERSAAAAISGHFPLIFGGEQTARRRHGACFRLEREEQPCTLPGALADVCLLFFGQRCL